MLKRSLVLASLLPGLCWAAGPLPQDLFVRGAFNGWGADTPLLFKGGSVYEADIVISPGYHAFKLGSKDWATEWVIDPQASKAVALDKDYSLATQAGPHDYLFVKATATYRFHLDVSGTPKLQVTRIGAASTVQGDPHKGNTAQAQMQFATFDGKHETVRFSSPDAAAALRSYVQSSTSQQRDPGPSFVTYQEQAGLPVTRTGNLGFDALFALALDEMRRDSVDQIRDGNYNGGGPIDCRCFETGEKWHYVWTRDLSYAARLGLAMLDPQRVRNSLEFKLSPLRAAKDDTGLQIIQDTGSGGSWPVSTDRVSWAFGAQAVLDTLPAAEREAFSRRALQALITTIENDRAAAFDTTDGLYTGEESFLDWREQTYASWIVNDIASMASAKALSTNVAHYQALRLAARLAREQGDAGRASRYDDWAAALKQSINKKLWLSDAGLYSSLTGPHFDGAPLRKFDWLGQSLAILTGVADPERARSILAHYPHGPMGAPVIYPQQRDVPVYHNRAIWPFVTAYGLKAAAMSGQTSVADTAYATLMRGAALNLSNMENLEWLSGQPLLLDEKHPELIGPVINSKRQLWSVGAYAGMVIENVFGLSTTPEGIRIAPFVTSRLRSEAFHGQQSILLRGLRLRDKTIDVRLQLPDESQQDGYYTVRSLSLNGAKADASIGWSALADKNDIVVQLGQLVPGQQALTKVKADPQDEDARVFGPHEPEIRALQRQNGGKVKLQIAGEGRLQVFRDGKPVAKGLKPGWWEDTQPGLAPCYTVEARVGANTSHHSVPACAGLALEIPVTDARTSSSIAATPPAPRFDLPAVRQWGAPDDQFSVRDIDVPHAGLYAVQIRYHNSANQINLGISGGVKRLRVLDEAGHSVAEGIIQLPHAKLDAMHTPPVYSTPLMAKLAPGRYSIELMDFMNMSYLRANASFTTAGGVDGPSNRFDIFGLRLLARDPE